MDLIIKFADGFMSLFKTGGETFISWMTGIVPVVLMLLVAMNALIALIGEDKIQRVAQASTKNPIARYLALPFLSAFMLGNPMSNTMESCNFVIQVMVFFLISTQVNYLFGWVLHKVFKN